MNPSGRSVRIRRALTATKDLAKRAKGASMAFLTRSIQLMEVAVPKKDPKRWTQNEDGTWSRVKPGKVVESDIIIETEPEPEPVPAPEPEPEPEAEAEAELTPYSEMTKAELEDELVSRGLSKTGNKAELLDRLEANDRLGS